MFGLLYAARREAGLPTTVAVEVPAGGTTARQIARDLELDLNIIEGVFVNRTVYDLGHRVVNGDRIAFVPEGTPGPHRLFLGLYKAGRDTADADESGASSSD